MSTARYIAQPAIHILSEDNAYGETQTSDDIRDGDVLVIPTLGVVGFLCGAWPVALRGDWETVGFHTLSDDADITRMGAHDGRRFEMWADIPADPGTDYTRSIELAQRVTIR